MTVTTTSTCAGQDFASQEQPVVDSFTITAQIRSRATDTAARLTITAPADVEVPRTAVISALLTLGQRVLEEHRITDRTLPEVEATTVERVDTAPSTPSTDGFVLVVTNDLAARRSAIAVDTTLSTDTEQGVLLVAATLFAGAEHLLELEDHPHHQLATTSRASPRRRARRHRGNRRPRPASS